MKVHYSKAFHKDFHDLSAEIRTLAEKQLRLFVENPRHPSLGIKKIHGPVEGRWEGRITRRYRFTFDWYEDTVVLRRIDTHEMIDREAKAK